VLESTRPGGWDTPSDALPAPLALHRTTVPAGWVDYNGHMSEWCYLLAMGDNSDRFFRFIGIDEDYRASGFSLYTVETHIRNLDEAGLGDDLHCTLRVLGVDAKRVHIAHELFSDDRLLATGEQMLLHVDMSEGRTAPLPDVLHERLVALVEAHSTLPTPDWVGRRIALPA
jgi:acyl-CoA thioester hydrolase